MKSIYTGDAPPGMSGGGGGGVAQGPGDTIADEEVVRGDTSGVQGSSVYISDGTSPLVKLGGVTASFPAIKRSGTGVQVRLADDSGFSTVQGLVLVIGFADDDEPAAFGPQVLSHNGSAPGAIVLDLPSSPVIGQRFEFSVLSANSLQVRVPGAQVIRVGGSASTAGGTVTSSTIGSFLQITYARSNTWVGVISGTWSFA